MLSLVSNSVLCMLLASSGYAFRSSSKLSQLHAIEARQDNAAPPPPPPAGALVSYIPTNASIFQMSSDSQFSFYVTEVLALANEGGANIGEVLRAATEVVPGDFESMYNAFLAIANPILDIANGIDVKIDPVGAREAYFRAASYFRAADFFLHGNQSDPRIETLWNSQLSAFNKAIALLPIPGERFSIPSHSDEVGDFQTIGVFYKASAGCGEKRPTVIIGNGYDGSQEESYHSVVVEFLKRGINCVTYEGPGQPTVRRQQKLGFISDWWNVVTPVVNYLEKRDDVDTSRMALFGISFGGVLAPRAASKEKRLSAVLAVDGISNFTDIVTATFPPNVTQLYTSGNKQKYDEVINEIRNSPKMPTSLRWFLDQSLWSFNTLSAYDWVTRLSKITMLAPQVKELAMPVFVGKGQDDTTTLNQPEIAYKLLSTERPNGQNLTTYHEFASVLGAGEHCTLGAEAQLNQVVLKWLSDVWGGYSFASHK